MVKVPPNNKVPARIISFSRSIESPWKENLVLPCRKVGVPSPVTIWRQEGQAMETNSRKTIAKNGTLFIRDCMSVDDGNYCKENKIIIEFLSSNSEKLLEYIILFHANYLTNSLCCGKHVGPR